jgi:hypothetical protein
MGLFQKTQSDFPNKYSVQGKKIICPHCGNDTFFLKPDILLNTRGLAFLELDWANKSASALICGNCSRIEWFFNLPSQTQ